MGYGENTDREKWNGCRYGLHAEMASILKLRKRKRITNIDMIVLRLGKHDTLKNSKPCQKCIETMSKIVGFKINRVYYSTGLNTIAMVKLSELRDQKNKHVSTRFRRNRVT